MPFINLNTLKNAASNVTDSENAKLTASDQSLLHAQNMYLSQILNKNIYRIEEWDKRKIQQGVVTINNKYVISGCDISDAGSWKIQLVQKRSPESKNFSKIYMNAQVYVIKDEDALIAALPDNKTNGWVDCYSYLVIEDGKPVLKAGFEYPEGSFPLHKIHLDSNNAKFRYDNIFRTEKENPSYFYEVTPSAKINFKNVMAGENYYVMTEVISAAGRQDPVIKVADKNANGFTLLSLSDADNIKVRWIAIQATA